MQAASNSTHNSFLSRLARREDGNVGMIFGIMLPVMVGFCGLAVDYNRTDRLYTKLRNTADSAALAATSAAFDDPTMTPDQATAIAQAYWNTMAKKFGCDCSATVSTVSGNGTMTTTVAYTGNEPTVFGGLFGVKTMKVGGTAIAQTEGAAARKGGMTGNGLVWGDPHVVGADGSTFIFQCPDIGKWYSMLSDSGIQVNVTCAPYGVEQVVSQVSVTLNSASGQHNIQFGNPYELKSVMPGQLTVDGKTFVAPLGQSSYADGQAIFNFGSLSNAQPDLNNLSINTAQYQIKMSYNQWNEYFYITVNGAGKCNPPGGFWGETLVGINDTNGADFLVNSPTYTSAQFSNGACPVTAALPHLIK